MTIRDQLATLKRDFFQQTEDFFQALAAPFGFPENPGMPVLPIQAYDWEKPSFRDKLPTHLVRFPPDSGPKNYFEVIVGQIPKPATIPRVFYESTTDGFYNFYIPNYKNIFFLPNWVSEFFQIQCKQCVDISQLEVFREMLFLALLSYYYIINLRLFLGWLVIINPYTIPWSFFIALVDWVDELSTGVLPAIGGTNYAMPILMAIVGKMADSLNHLVFTMPFLPSEGVPAKIVVEGETLDVLVFRHLPFLWYKYPIPNDIRLFWVSYRPDILSYMEKYYKHLDIQLLPDLTNLT